MAEKTLNGWVRIHTTPILYRAEMVRDILMNTGIEAILLNQSDENFKFGFADVYVQNENEYEALALIENEISFG